MRNWNDDHYTKKARNESYLARSVYKLGEIDKRERVLSGVKLAIDLGSAPGSWTQYILEKLPSSRVIGVDISPMEIEDERLTFLHRSIGDVNFAQVLEGKKADLVVSDMAPKTSGQHIRDCALSYELCMLALSVAREHLKPGGSFVCKIFMGGDFEAFHKDVKTSFGKVRLLRPDSTRKQSREIFIVAKDFRYNN